MVHEHVTKDNFLHLFPDFFNFFNVFPANLGFSGLRPKRSYLTFPEILIFLVIVNFLRQDSQNFAHRNGINARCR